jgi:hypothetical protein
MCCRGIAGSKPLRKAVTQQRRALQLTAKRRARRGSTKRLRVPHALAAVGHRLAAIGIAAAPVVTRHVHMPRVVQIVRLPQEAVRHRLVRQAAKIGSLAPAQPTVVTAPSGEPAVWVESDDAKGSVRVGRIWLETPYRPTACTPVPSAGGQVYASTVSARAGVRQYRQREGRCAPVPSAGGQEKGRWRSEHMAVLSFVLAGGDGLLRA